MADKYSPRERLQIVFRGEQPDRYAASIWRHFFHKEHYAEGTAEAMLDFQKRFGWDFMKINPRADYHIEGWGFRQEWSLDEFKKHKKTRFPVTKVEDWADIEPLTLSSPALDEHLNVVRMIRKKSDPELPILMTVFTPLAIAGRMVEDNRMLADHIRNHPDSVLTAIEAITQTFEAFVAELRNAGADGIFLATTHWASEDLVSWEEYQRFGVPFDLRLAHAAESDAINLFHICDSNNYLKELLSIKIPAHMINWYADDPTNLPIDKGVETIREYRVVGGIDHEGWLLHSTPVEIAYKIQQIKQKIGPEQLIIGPGCAIPPEVPMANLHAIKDNL